jgi:hypothetical protein
MGGKSFVAFCVLAFFLRELIYYTVIIYCEVNRGYSGMKPRIFIGSSSSGKRIVGALQAALQNSGYDYDIKPWYQGAFGLSETTIESLEKILDNSDFAILILTPDDVIIKKDETQITPRDNVILELGLFSGRLGRKRTFILCERDAGIGLPSDLFGITIAYYDNCKSDSDLLGSLNPIGFQINSAIVATAKEDYLLANLENCVEQFVKVKSLHFNSSLDSTAYTLVPRILQLICEDEYYTKLERKVIISPDEYGKLFSIETSTIYNIHTNRDSYARKAWNWYKSAESRDSVNYTKFTLDGEDRLDEYNSLMEFKSRNRRDYVSSFGATHKPIPYHNASQSHVIKIEISREQTAQGFLMTHAMFSTLARDINITFQLSGEFASNWEIKAHSFSAFKYAGSPYADEYRQITTTTHNMHINYVGWALPGWGYYYTVQPKMDV